MTTLRKPPTSNLGREAFNEQGAPITTDARVTLVTQARNEAMAFVQKRQWTLLWRDADILYQSPRPLSVWENTYVQEPNVTRFTVLNLCSGISAQINKGLFYEDPPMVLRPRGGTTKQNTDWKREVMTYLMRDMNLEEEVKLGVDQLVLLGTTVFKRTIVREQITVTKRKATQKQVAAGAGQSQTVPTDDPPQLEKIKRFVTRVKFEMLDIAGDTQQGEGGEVLVDPKLSFPNIQKGDWVIHRGWVDFYDLRKLAADTDYTGLAKTETKTRPNKNDDGSEGEEEYQEVATDEDGEIELIEDVRDWFFPPAETSNTPTVPEAEGNVVHHAETPTGQTTNPLNKKLEILEYLNQKTDEVIVVLNGAKVIREGPSEGKIRYYSANCFNRRRAFWGIGVGLIAGQDQRVQQGGLNAALKVLNFGLDKGYWAEQGAMLQTQMIRTGIGRIHTIADISKAPKLIDTPKVEPEIWQVLANSKAESEAATGGDQLLVGGSTAGPRSSILRTSRGAGIAAGANSTRLDGPLGHLIDQVMVPLFYDLDDIIKRYISDGELLFILGERLGEGAIKDLDMQAFHDGRHEYDVLAGAKLAAKATMAQSLVLIGQYIFNPAFQQFMAEVHGQYYDQKVFMDLVLTSAEWGQGVAESLVKPLTDDMKKAMAAKQQANSKLQEKLALQESQAQIDSQLEDQKAQNRVAGKIATDAMRAAGESEAVLGQPEGVGFGSPQEGVVS